MRLGLLLVLKLTVSHYAIHTAGRVCRHCEKSCKHRRQPRRGCRGRIPTNILVGGDINGNVPTNIQGGNVVEYELLIASVKRKQR